MIEEGKFRRRHSDDNYNYRVRTGLKFGRQQTYAEKQLVADRVRWCNETLGVNAHAIWNHRYEPRLGSRGDLAEAMFFFDKYEHAVAFTLRWK